jgi:hypothetical protein
MKYPEFFICDENPCLCVYRAHVLCSLVYLLHGAHLSKTITPSNTAVVFFFLILIEDTPLCLTSKVKQNVLELPSKPTAMCKYYYLLITLTLIYCCVLTVTLKHFVLLVM